MRAFFHPKIFISMQVRVGPKNKMNANRVSPVSSKSSMVLVMGTMVKIKERISRADTGSRIIIGAFQ